MDALRKPFFIAALVLILLVVLAELGSGLAFRAKASDGAALLSQAGKVSGMGEYLGQIDLSTMGDLQQRKPPGAGIPFMAFLDGLVLFTVTLMGGQFFLGERLQGRVQGIISLIVSLLLLLAAIAGIVLTVAKVLLMIGLFVSIPFGTLAYLAIWGSFNTGAAKVTLGLLLALKLGFGACLVLAHQRFLQNKGLVAIVVTSLCANLVVSFLHAVVPSVLVSITDGIGGIVVLVLAAIWALFLLIGSIISVTKAIV